MFFNHCHHCIYSMIMPFGKVHGYLWRRQWQPTPVLLPGKSHGQRCLVGCSPWGRQESDTTEQLHFDFSLSCIGEGNGNPLQWSCLENPRDGGAWWAAISGVAQSQTRLKGLSSSNPFIQIAFPTTGTVLPWTHSAPLPQTSGSPPSFTLFQLHSSITLCLLPWLSFLHI